MGEKLDKYSKEIVTEWGKFSWRCKLAFKQFFRDIEDSKFVQPVDLNKLKSLLMHLHVCLQSEARLASAVHKSLEERHPLPLVDMEAIVSLASLEFDEAVAKVASNEDETSALEQTVTSNVTAMTALLKKVREAAADVKKIIEKKQKDDVKDQEKLEKQKIKDMENIKKDHDKAANTKAKASAKTSAQSKTVSPAKTAIIQDPPLLVDLSVIPDMKEFADEGRMNTEIPAAGVPYAIKKCPSALVEVLKERGVTSAMGLFKILMMEPNNPSMKQNGRAQQPFQSDRKKRVAEMLTACAPNDILSQVTHKLPETWHQTLSQTHLFACSEDMVQCGVERNALGNIRIQTTGVRVVVVLLYEALDKISKARSMTRQQEEDEVDFMRRVLTDVQPQDIAGNARNMVWKYTMDASSSDLAKSPVMVIPPGTFTIEKTIASKNASGAIDRAQSFVIGLRQHFLESSESPGYRSLKLLQTAHVNHKGVDTTSAFWGKILDACVHSEKGVKDKGKSQGKGNACPAIVLAAKATNRLAEAAKRLADKKEDEEKNKALEEAEKKEAADVAAGAEKQIAEDEAAAEKAKAEKAPKAEKEKVEKAAAVEKAKAEKAVKAEKEKVEKAAAVEKAKAEKEKAEKEKAEKAVAKAEKAAKAEKEKAEREKAAAAAKRPRD